MPSPATGTSQEYQRLSLDSIHRTPSEDCFMTKEKFYERRARYWRLTSIMLFVLGTFIIALLLDIRLYNTQPKTNLPYAGVLVPKLKTQDVVFMNDSKFANDEFLVKKDVFEEGMKAWYNLFPAGYGFIQVSNEDREKYKLPTPIKDYALLKNSPSQYSVYSLSSYHKLHCLISIMEVYAKPKLGFPDNEPMTPGHAAHHVAHCYDYLRQSILCESDTTLEGRMLYSDELGTDGWGATHVCRDHMELFRWAGKHQVQKPPTGSQ